jgi:type IV pilus assembly protein PilW
VDSVTEEMVEGVESLQFIYGQDQSVDVAQLRGNVTEFGTAAELGAPIANENAWRRVGQIKVGLVVASPEPAAAAAPQNGDAIRALGTTFTPPAGGQYRSTYETAIALRNRLYGN